MTKRMLNLMLLSWNWKLIAFDKRSAKNEMKQKSHPFWDGFYILEKCSLIRLQLQHLLVLKLRGEGLQ